MIVSFFIFSAADNTLLPGVLATFAYFKRRNDDGSITTLSNPAITDTGGGRYEFPITDADLTPGSTIDYVIDCTTDSAGRYLTDSVDSDTVLAEESEETGDGVLVFGVTAATVRQHCFPRLSNWSATTSPTANTVTEKIEAAASRLAGALAAEAIAPASILTNTAGYAICADVIRKLVALELGIPMDDPATAVKWQREVDAFFVRLEEQGWVALGVAGSGAGSNPNGPTTHISEYGLEIDSVDEMSTARMPLRKDDAL